MDGKRWQILSPLLYVNTDGTQVSIPAGFVTDFASVPQIFWNIIPPIGDYAKAAVLHDYLYRFHVFARAQCDAYLLDGMKELGTPLWKRLTIYWNVRAFGFIAWRNEP